MTAIRRLITVPNFSTHTEPLRNVFDARFADPRRATADRFQWDYWNVPGQFTALRTPAWEFFPKAKYEALHRALVQWGREHLGCHDISPPWLSCYVEGCGQELHGDVPHGPFAYVLSLTRWDQRVFQGGQTTLLREPVLDWWSNPLSSGNPEYDSLIEEVPAQWNQLTVFDPRIPHGVKQVRGTTDPRQGRLAIHGWFVSPRPFIEGPVKSTELDAKLNTLFDSLAEPLGQLSTLSGVLNLRFQIGVDGRVTRTKTLADTTRVTRAEEALRVRVAAGIAREVKAWRFSNQRKLSTITLPLVFASQ